MVAEAGRAARSGLTPRHATFAAFLSFGVSIGLWSGSVPVVALASGVTPGLLGVGVTCGIVGAILGTACAGVLARHVALQRTLPIGVVAMAAAVALALQAGSLVAFFAGFLLLGLAAGTLDGTMNAEGVAVERDLRRPVLVAFHAACSFASALAAAAGGAISVRLGTGATALAAIAAALMAASVIRRATPPRPVEARAAGARRGRIGLPILLLGIVTGVGIGCEVAATMFAASTIRQQAPALAAFAGMGAGAFLIFQAGVRSATDSLRRRIGDADLIALSMLVSGVGCAIVATGSGIGQSALGFAVIGIGTAAVTPCAFALATRLPGLSPAQAIGLVSLISAIPRVPQPLGFGAIAEDWGFAAGYALNGALLVVALGLALWFRAMVRRGG